jgi:hypothetical protein
MTNAVQPHVEMLLAGDFSSPVEVLASHDLTTQQKRQILELWQHDLSNKLELRDARVLLACVEEALASLDPWDRPH